MNDPPCHKTLICIYSTYHAKFSLSLVSPHPTPEAGWTPPSFGLNQSDSDLSLMLHTFFFPCPDVVVLLTAASVRGQ